MIEVDIDTIGVVIARMQVPKLHLGHRYLLDYVLERHPRSILILGAPPMAMRQVSSLNPLSYELRTAMIREFYSEDRLIINKVHDIPGNNERWAFEVDELIKYLVPNQVKLYGSRESFIPYYIEGQGKHPTNVVPPMPNVPSGTVIRNQVYKTPSPNSEEFRRGVIWASQFM